MFLRKIKLRILGKKLRKIYQTEKKLTFAFTPEEKERLKKITEERWKLEDKIKKELERELKNLNIPLIST